MTWRLDPRAIVAALALWLVATGARAGVANAPGSALEVALVTYGPGAIYWERFGHDAIEIRDRDSGEAVTFNYGMFDFSQKHFLLNFARGHMRYSMDAVHARDDIDFYIGEGRSVRRQTLALSAAEAARLRDALLVNLEPANAAYDYDYFRANCATRVRDALDAALGGQLARAWQDTPSPLTYRSETDRLMAPQPWLMLLLDLGLGPAADQPLSQWQANFVPMRLADAVARIDIGDARGARRPLMLANTVVARGRLPSPPAAAPDWFWRFLIVGLLVAAALAWSGGTHQRAARIGFRVGASLFALLAGLAGLAMATLWTATAHTAAWANQNLMLLNPAALALLPALWRLGRGDGRSGRFGARLAIALALLAALALAAKPILAHQHNAQWIALALPIWCAIALVAWRRRDGDCQRP